MVNILQVSVRKRHESFRVFDAFVKDESVAFGTFDDSEVLGGEVSPEETGAHHIDVASFVERLSDLVDQVLTHDVIVELPGFTYIEGGPLTLQQTFH